MRALLAGLALCVACNTHVHSPPIGTFPIEGPASVGGQRQSVSGDASFAKATFGPSASTYRLSYRYGLSEQLEVSASPSMIWIAGASPGDSHPGIYGVRAAVKYAPIRHVSASLGVGGGASAAGAFLSPDVGLTLGWDNRYLVPFAAGRFFLSAPVAPRAVHFTIGDDSGDRPHDRDADPDRYRRTPHFSYGVQVSAGLRAPLSYNLEQRLRPALSCALGSTLIFDHTSNNLGFFGFGCGVDLGF
jgi:hypothetical protein